MFLCHSGLLWLKDLVQSNPLGKSVKYRKLPIISPGLIFGFAHFFWAYFRVGLFSGGLTFGSNFLHQDVGLINGMNFQN